MQRRVGKGAIGCVCVVLLVVMVTCVYVSILLCSQIWAVVHRYIANFPLSLPTICFHSLVFCITPFFNHPLSILLSVPDLR